MQAEALVKAQQDIGEALGELGLAFIKLAKFETDEATCDSQRIRASEIKRLATAAVKASRFYRESNAQTVKHLVFWRCSAASKFDFSPGFYVCHGGFVYVRACVCACVRIYIFVCVRVCI